MATQTTTGLEGAETDPTILPEVQWAIAAGTANALTAAFSPAITELPDGLIVGTRALLANTTINPTFAPDTFPARTITREGGSALNPGDIAGVGHELLLRYNLANTRWELLNPASAAALFKLINSIVLGQNVNTAQPWFPTAGGITVPAGTYFFEGVLLMARSAGTTSHTTKVLFGGTAVASVMPYVVMCKTGDAQDLQNCAANFGVQGALDTTGVQVKAASTSATENIMVYIRGFIIVTAAGTIIPQFQFSAAPGGAPSIYFGTFFRLTKSPGTSYGAWA